MGSDMRIFIDSNVLISGIVFDRNELEVIVLSAERGFQLYISDHVMTECRGVFSRKFPAHQALLDSFVHTAGFKVVARKEYQGDVEKFDEIRDRYDAHVVACAKRMGCQYIITGDKDILTYPITDVRVMNSTAFIREFLVDGKTVSDK